MNDDEPAWVHVLAVTRPAHLLASPEFLEEIADALNIETRYFNVEVLLEG